MQFSKTKKLFNKDTDVQKWQIPASNQPKLEKEIHPISKDDSSIEQRFQEETVQYKKNSAPDTYSTFSHSPVKSPQLLNLDDSSDSDEEIDYSVSPRSPKKSPQLPKPREIPKPKYPLLKLPRFIITIIFKYVLNLEENGRLNDNGSNDLLMFYNNKKENQQILKAALLCLQALIGSNKSTLNFYDPLAYADPEKLFQIFSKSRKAQQYFSDALSKLGEIEDLLDKQLVEDLAKELSVFENGNYIESIAFTAATTEITSLINKDNIKEIINLLQLPDFDEKKINELHVEINSIIEQCDRIDLTRNSYGRISGTILLLLIAGGLGVGSYFSAKRHKKGDDSINSFLFLAVLSAICGFLAIIGSCVLGMSGSDGRINSRNDGHLAFYYNKNEINRKISSSSSFLNTVAQYYNEFYEKNNLSLTFDKYSEALHKQLVKINNNFIDGLDWKNKTFRENYRFGWFAQKMPKLEKMVEYIELDIEIQPQPNNNSFVNENSSLLINNN